jgi:NAD(P)H-nitrite reductase large subunit
MAAFAIGVRPRLSLAAASGLETARGIRVDQYLATSAPDIYAAGDVAEVFDPVSGRGVVDSLWNPARAQGTVAGMNLAGERQPYQLRSALNITRLTGVTTTIIGQVGTGKGDDGDDLAIVRGESETWHQLPDAVICQNNFDVNRLRVMVGETRLVGALLMGDQSVSRALEDLVAEEVDITPIRQALVTPGADLGRIVFKYWQQWRQANAD